MQVQNLDGKEVMIIGFGGCTLLTAVVLVSIFVGHTITRTSSTPQPVYVGAPPANVTVAVPQAAAPKVEVACPAAHVDVHVPASPPPTVNVSTPPATVTIVERDKEATQKPPANSSSTPPKVDAKPIPVVAPTEPKASSEAEVGIESLYTQAERYIESYCQKQHLDPVAEGRRWNEAWTRRVATAIQDGGTEQSLMDRTIVDCRACFDQNATTDKIVEGCRLMLCIRDRKLNMLEAMKSALTRENLIKTVAFLQAGVK